MTPTDTHSITDAELEKFIGNARLKRYAFAVRALKIALELHALRSPAPEWHGMESARDVIAERRRASEGGEVEPDAYVDWSSQCIYMAENIKDPTGLQPVWFASPSPSPTTVSVKELEEDQDTRDLTREQLIDRLRVHGLNGALYADEADEAYEIGKREGYEQAVQKIDLLTGGDGEYRFCTDHDPDRHTPTPAHMIERIVDRFSSLQQEAPGVSEAVPLDLAERVIALADELCDAVDAAAEDVGGYRSTLAILQDIGPIIGAAKAQIAALSAKGRGPE